MPKLTVVIFLLLFPVLAFSVKVDTVIFSNSLERKVFNDYFEGKNPDPVKFMCAIYFKNNTYNDYRQKINETISFLRGKSIESKSEGKKIKMIVSAAKSKMLKTYDEYERASLNDLVSDGLFTTISSLLVYAGLLDTFDIDYKIHHTPYEIYIEAGGKQIRNKYAKNTLFLFTPDLKKQCVKFYHDNGLIKDNDFYYSGFDKLFDKYYSSKTEINLYELVAFQYYIKGVTALQMFSDRKGYFYASEKACFLYPENNYLRFNEYQAVSSYLMLEYSRGGYSGYSIAVFANLISDSKELTKTAADQYRIYLMNAILEESKYDECAETHSEFKKYVSDTVDFSVYDYHFNNVTAYYFLLQKKYYKSLDLAEAAYKYNPDNLNLKGIIHDDILGIIKTYDKEKKDYGYDSIVYYFNRFPYVLDYEEYQKLMVAILSFNVTLAFDEKKYDRKYDAGRSRAIAAIDSLMTSRQDLKYEEGQVELMCDFIYDYYDETGNTDSLKAVFKRFSGYFPDIDCSLDDMESSVNKKKSRKKNGSYSSEETDDIIINSPPKKYFTVDEYRDYVKRILPGCWKSTEYRLKGSDEIKKMKELKFTAKKNTYVEYYDGEKKLIGTWSLRPGAKLLYFTPKNKSYYLTFRILKITDSKIEVQQYKGDKLEYKVLIFKRCR